MEQNRTKQAEHTPRPWILKDVAGAGLQIWASVNIGSGEEGGGVLQPIYDVSLRPTLLVDNNGVVTMQLSYKTWRQFPSIDFCAMQKANARLIAAAPDLLTACKALMARLDSHFGGANKSQDWQEQEQARTAIVTAIG